MQQEEDFIEWMKGHKIPYDKSKRELKKKIAGCQPGLLPEPSVPLSGEEEEKENDDNDLQWLALKENINPTSRSPTPTTPTSMNTEQKEQDHQGKGLSKGLSGGGGRDAAVVEPWMWTSWHACNPRMSIA